MSKEKQDILFEIDMQLYDEFNDKIATMNDHLGDVYSLRDIEEVEQAKKDKEIRLLRKAIRTQQKTITKMSIDIIEQLQELDKKDRKIEELQKEAGYKKCILCQKIYKPKKSNQIYCSKSCLNRVMCKRYKQRHKEQILEYAKKYRAKKKVDKDGRN